MIRLCGIIFSHNSSSDTLCDNECLRAVSCKLWPRLCSENSFLLFGFFYVSPPIVFFISRISDLLGHLCREVPVDRCFAQATSSPLIFGTWFTWSHEYPNNEKNYVKEMAFTKTENSLESAFMSLLIGCSNRCSRIFRLTDLDWYFKQVEKTY